MERERPAACRERISRCGFTLVELAVVMALIGLTATVAGVYLSSQETVLRTTVRNLRFDLEQAKQEAVAKNAAVFVDFPEDLPPLDCNGDGAIDGKDRCYAIYRDTDGTDGFDSATGDILLKAGLLDPSIVLLRADRLSFLPSGTSSPGAIELKIAGKADNCPIACGQTCEERDTCYLLTVNQVGRIKEECVYCSQ